MKTNRYIILSIAVGIILSLFLYSCDSQRINPEGVLITKEYDFVGVEKIKVSSIVNLKLKKGEKEKLTIKADKSIEDLLSVVKKDKELYIGTKGFLYNLGSIRIDAEYTYVSLEGLEAKGAAKIRSEEEISENDFEIELSGASSFEGNVFVVENFDARLRGASSLSGNIVSQGATHIELSGASHIGIKGSSSYAELIISGASSFDAQEWEIGSLDISSAGASSASLYVTDKIDAEARGASVVSFKGDADIIKRETKGASSITKME